MTSSIFGAHPFLGQSFTATRTTTATTVTTRSFNITSNSYSSYPPLSSQQTPPSSDSNGSPLPAAGNNDSKKPAATKTADSTDWIASSLTRRFGLGAGLAWVGFLAAGVISEQVKTRLEVSQQLANTREVEKEEEVVLPNGIKYYELKVGGGATPRAGDLVVIDLKGRVVGGKEVSFVDTFERKKPLALVMGSRPYTRGMCEGIEYVLRSMKAGGKRRVIVPPSLGFGENGADLGSESQTIPPSSTLEYIVEVERVSIAPA
ncbi:unnamed protein product [Linum tenue]|uniref:peptidylprolyl isomerase n=1 Tax=Linum tenue TaxID=586396 RepID=A0AAV0IUX1_9ROSI|nr:unnamed protein product [Linum tenue]